MEGGSAQKAKSRRQSTPRSAKKRSKPIEEDSADAAGEEDTAAAEKGAKSPATKRARVEKTSNKPAGKGNSAAKAETAVEEAVEPAGTEEGEAGAAAAAKPARTRKLRAKAAAAAVATPAEEGEQEGEGAKPKPKAKPKAKRGEKVEPLPVYTTSMRKPAPPEGSSCLKVLSWNVAGLRALLKKTPDAISSLVSREGAEVVCLQEHKLQAGHTDDVAALMGLKGWHHYWACSTAKLGYSGVSVHTRTKPLSVIIGLGAATPIAAAAATSAPADAAADADAAVADVAAGAAAASDAGSDKQPAAAPDPDPEHEVEGRVVTVELPAAFLVCVYVPNSSEGLKRLDYRTKRWDVAFAAFLKGLQRRGKPVIVTGDLNCAHKEIDIHAPKTNLRSAGFTVEERESFGRLLLGEVGLVDTFRSFFPNMVAYTYFTRRFNCREQNKGWRLDYFLTSSSLMPPPGETAQAESAAAQAEGEAPPVAAMVPPPPTEWRVYDTWIMQDVYGSDHLPLGLTLVKEAAASGS